MSPSSEQILRNKETPTPSNLKSSQFQSANILIVEDESKIAKAISDAVVEAGFQTEVCNNGETGYKTALENKFHLIILDVNLPGKMVLIFFQTFAKTDQKLRC